MIELLIIALAVLGFALVSRRLTGTPVTAPMVFTTVGLLVGSAGAAWFDVTFEGEPAQALVEATLVLVLFTDAARIDLGALRRYAGIPVRLLVVGLPLTVLAGTLLALLLLDGLTFGEALLLATILAPTDAALGQAVVSDHRLPVRVRQSLNVESGLNDGIAAPLVTVAIALAAAEADPGGSGELLAFVARQLGFGLACGLLAGVVGARAQRSAVLAGRVEGAWRQLATLAVAAAAFAGAELFGGNGFVAAFVAGLAFGRVAREETAGVQEFSQDEGELLTVVTFLVFGAALAGPRVDLGWTSLLYALASLTVVRMLPVLLALAGSGTRLRTRVFLAWFGPRGLASILFVLLALDELDAPGVELVADVAVLTVLLSVFAHGLSAAPWAGRLAERLRADAERGGDGAAELGHDVELPTRRGRRPGARTSG